MSNTCAHSYSYTPNDDRNPHRNMTVDTHRGRLAKHAQLALHILARKSRRKEKERKTIKREIETEKTPGSEISTLQQLLIERWFPVRELSRDAEIEMSYKGIPAYIKHCRELKATKKGKIRDFYDPKIRNMHPWFARRPCSVARATTLAALLPAHFPERDFMKAIGWDEKATTCVAEQYPPLLVNCLRSVTSKLHGWEKYILKR